MSTRRLATLVGLGALLAGCGEAPSDKAGGKTAGEVRVLRLTNANDLPYELEAFAREVERASSGRLRIRFVNDWRQGKSDPEPGVFDDVRAGMVDLAWVGARALKAEGVDAFDPLIAPFQVTDYETEERVVRSPVAAEMLDAVDAAGVHGVALLPGPLRRLGMREPWHGPADLAGKRISAPAGIGSEAVKALGAIPVVTGSYGRTDGIDGAEQHLGAFLGNGYVRTIPHIAVQPLWPRPLVIIAAPRLWDELAAADREALAEAGRSAVAPVLDDVRATDKEALPKLCKLGTRFFEADLEALRRAVEPVYAQIRRDGATARSLDAIEKLRGPAGPTVACPAAAPEAEGGLPPGTYTWTITQADALTRPKDERAGTDKVLPQVFRAEITPGHIAMTVRVKGGPEEFGLEADYSVFKDRIDIDGGTITGRWKVENGNLRFSDIGPAAGDRFVFETKTWKRVR